MFNLTATQYFRTFADLMCRVEATDQDGVLIPIDDATAQAVERMAAVARAAGKVLLIGNGGSAAIASHMQNDLSKALGLRAMTFTEPPLMTALSNDEGYLSVFERPICLWANPGDLLVAISSSGRSENVLRGVRACHARGGQTITFSGFNPDNPLRQLGVLNFYAPSKAYGCVESVHGLFTHMLTDCALSAWPMSNTPA